MMINKGYLFIGAITLIALFMTTPADARSIPEEESSAEEEYREGSPAESDETDIQEEVGLRAVEGEVVAIDGEYYVVKDAKGQKLRLHVSAETEIQGTVKVGDLIEADVLDDGHAVFIAHVRT